MRVYIIKQIIYQPRSPETPENYCAVLRSSSRGPAYETIHFKGSRPSCKQYISPGSIERLRNHLLPAVN